MPYLPIDSRHSIHYLEFNPAGSKTVLLLHGLGATGDSWVLQVPALIESGYRLLAPDVRGFGKSDFPGGKSNITDMSQDMARLLEETHTTSAAVVGISMGGTIALQLALDTPCIVDHLVLINTFSSLRPKKASIWLYFAFRFILVHTLGLKVQAKAVSRRIFPNPQQETFRQELERQIASADERGYRSAMRALGKFNVTHRLGEIQCPTLIITGAEDSTVPPENQRQLVEGIQNARQIMIPGAGHAVTIQEPERVNQILLEFFGR